SGLLVALAVLLILSGLLVLYWKAGEINTIRLNRDAAETAERATGEVIAAIGAIRLSSAPLLSQPPAETKPAFTRAIDDIVRALPALENTGRRQDIQKLLDGVRSDFNAAHAAGDILGFREDLGLRNQLH